MNEKQASKVHIDEEKQKRNSKNKLPSDQIAMIPKGEMKEGRQQIQTVAREKRKQNKRVEGDKQYMNSRDKLGMTREMET